MPSELLDETDDLCACGLLGVDGWRAKVGGRAKVLGSTEDQEEPEEELDAVSGKLS